jgi:hypothetical protein
VVVVTLTRLQFCRHFALIAANRRFQSVKPVFLH